MSEPQKQKRQQRRIVLNPDHEPLAQEILSQTGIDNLSQLFSIFIRCYGEDLITRMKGVK